MEVECEMSTCLLFRRELQHERNRFLASNFSSSLLKQATTMTRKTATSIKKEN
jgi:hypothetical protein